MIAWISTSTYQHLQLLNDISAASRAAGDRFYGLQTSHDQDALDAADACKAEATHTQLVTSGRSSEWKHYLDREAYEDCLHSLFVEHPNLEELLNGRATAQGQAMKSVPIPFLTRMYMGCETLAECVDRRALGNDMGGLGRRARGL